MLPTLIVRARPTCWFYHHTCNLLKILGLNRIKEYQLNQNYSALNFTQLKTCSPGITQYITSAPDVVFVKVYKLIKVFPLFAASDKRREKRGKRISELDNINSSVVIKPLTCRVFTSINHPRILAAVDVMVVWGVGGPHKWTEAKKKKKKTFTKLPSFNFCSTMQHHLCQEKEQACFQAVSSRYILIKHYTVYCVSSEYCWQSNVASSFLLWTLNAETGCYWRLYGFSRLF